ncbi:Fatty-acid amide hydrolase 1 [Fasciola gigantica]|uniref:Fatty-acid amide hydrolase 1 n=1 Tax=Fasciola gigantica TaxID=46835 RepID=A0A504YU27_FASGI|nr:Fatty-acid amide hydrolase 1 [Fasciola gigantica]
MSKFSTLHQVNRVIRHLLDFLALLYLLDVLTFYVCSDVLYFFTRMMLHANRWTFLRWIFIVYSCFRLGRFVFYRHRIENRLKNKQKDLLDKHGLLNQKLKMGEVPTLSADEATSMTMPELRSKLRERKLTAIDVIDAYQRKALEIYQRHPGCIAEIVFDSDVYAILADTKLDALKESDSKESYPLLGIPVSVQELFPIRGCDHTMGYTCRTKKAAEDDCALVAALKEAGAIPFVMANVRQKLMGLTSENPIFGRTRHPTHPHRACVSGDAALIAAHGSCLSFGADLFGAGRLTAAFCGLAAFKPTTGRMSQKGLNLPIRFPETLGVVATPIGRTVDDITDAFRALWTSALFKQDTSLAPINFDESQFTRGKTEKLRIGYYHGLEDLLPVSPSVDRVMEQTRHFLESKGHELVEFSLPDAGQAYQLTMSLVNTCIQPESLRLIYREGNGDVLVDYKQRAVHALYALPTLLRKSICHLRADAVESKYPVTALALRAMGCTKSYADLQIECDAYCKLVHEKWNDCELDCLICPVSPIPTPWDYSSFYSINSVLIFTSLYNLLGYPAGTVQVGQVERDDIEQARDAIKPGEDMKTLLMFAQQMDGSEGLPLGVQVVSKPWNDELALGVLKMLEQMKA